MMPARALDKTKAVTDGKLSVEEYLALDRAAEIPSEYYDGEMFPRAFASLAHSLISVKVGSFLNRSLEKSPCKAAGALRVRVSATKFLVPDFLVYCGKPQLTDEHQDTLLNPKVVIEILSDSTFDFDYGRKFIWYRGLPSVDEYLLISQDEPRIEVFQRSGGNQWLLTTYAGLDAAVPLSSIEAKLALREIYEGLPSWN